MAGTMRIGLITPGFSASEADWCIPALLDLVRELATRVEVRVFSLRYPHHQRPYAVYGANVMPFGGAQRGGGARVALWARAGARIIREARARPFDVLHALWADEPGMLAALAGRVTRTPALVSLLGGEIVDLRDIDYGAGRVNRMLARLSIRAASCVTVGSAFLAGLLRRWDPNVSALVRPLGIETTRFHPGGVTGEAADLDGAPCLLHVGSLVPVKDHATLFRAFETLLAALPAARLHVVGDGPFRNELERCAVSLGIGSQVRFHGAVPHERLPGYYRQATICVVSSRFESQSIAALEALACGCPVVGSAVGVLPELEGAIRTVPPGDAPVLAAALVDTVQHPGRLREMRLRGVERIRERFSLTKTVEQLLELYSDLARTGSCYAGS